MDREDFFLLWLHFGECSIVVVTISTHASPKRRRWQSVDVVGYVGPVDPSLVGCFCVQVVPRPKKKGVEGSVA